MNCRTEILIGATILIVTVPISQRAIGEAVRAMIVDITAHRVRLIENRSAVYI